MTKNQKKRSLDAMLVSEARQFPQSFHRLIGLTAFMSVLTIAQALLLSRIIQRAYELGETVDQLGLAFMGLLGVIGVRSMAIYLNHTVASQLAQQVKTSLQQRFLHQLYALGTHFTHQERSGDIVLSLTVGIEKLDGYYKEYLPSIFLALMLPLLILLVVLPLDALTFGVLLVTAPLIPFFMALIGMATGALAKQQFESMRFLSAHFLDVMQGLTTLKLFNRSRHQLTTIERITNNFRQATMRILRVAFLSAFTLEMLATLSVAVVAVEIGVRLIYGGIAFEQALFLLVIAPEFYLPLRTLGAKFHNSTESKAAAERIYTILELPLPSTVRHDHVISSFHTIEFENVTYLYPDGRLGVENLSFKITHGQHIAFVGRSGSGKTTVSQLLLRFIAPTSGRILVDGVDLQTVSLEAWRNLLTWVSQTPYLFNTTLIENMRMSCPTASDTQVADIARLVGLNTIIDTLPERYNTSVGEQGIRLSGGQAQRVAIARALMRPASLMLLDEPTSQLDYLHEKQVIDAIYSRSADKTIILFAHRLQTVLNSDWIIHLENGQVIEQGSHNMLLAKHAGYAQMVQEDEWYDA